MNEPLQTYESLGLLDEWAQLNGLHQINLPTLIDRLIDLAESECDRNQVGAILIDIASDLNKVLYYEAEHAPFIRWDK